jgi:NADPH:quinone reductase-like Zn-dependent oxidoreductase
MTERRIVRFHRTGGPEQLAIEAVPEASPGEGEVRIGVRAVGLNRAEVAFREGRYLERPVLPSRIGYEAAGVIEAVGAGVTGLAVGDRAAVMPLLSMSMHGVIGEFAVVPSSIVRRLPAGVAFETAAAAWMQYLTAHGALFDQARVVAGDVVVVTAASSSVGLAALALVREAGGVAIATTRSGEKRDALLAAGASHVIASEQEDVDEAVMRLTAGAGARVILDAVAGPGLAALCAAAAEGGVIVVYGALSGQFTPLPVLAALGKGLTIRGWTLRDLVRSGGLEAAIARIEAGLAEGRLSPVIARRFAFAEIVDAYRFLESNAQVGKVVVSVP